MKPLAIAFLALLLTGRTYSQTADLATSALHPSAAQDGVWEKSTQHKLQELTEDFDAVVAGRKPVHARHDTKEGVLADGGTSFYIGNGYKLTVEQSLCTIGGADGMLYGPIFTLGPELADGNDNQISHVTFYRMEEFRKLKNISP